MDKKKILFVVIASSEIGIGHFKRCLHLAEVLSIENISVTFASIEKDHVHKLAKKNGYAYDDFLHDKKQLACANNKYNLVLCDLLDKDLTKLGFKDNDLPVGFIYTFEPTAIYAEPQFIIFPGIDELDPNKNINSKNKIYSGPDYIVLDDYFATRNVKPRPLNQIRNILITMGGSDPFDLTSRLVKCFHQIDRDIVLQVVAGPGYRNLDQLKKMTNESPHECRFFHDPPDLIEIMEISDIAFAPGGTTRFELCSLGVPFVLLAFDDKQKKNNADFVQKYHVGFNLGLGKHINSDKVAYVLDDIENSKHQVEKMNLRAQEVIDGRGLYRCKKIILNHI